MTAHWACRTRGFTSEFELTGQQMLETLLIHDQHDQIHAFDSDLQSPATTANRHEGGRAPAVRCTTRGHSTAVLGAKNEAAFNQVRHHQDALCAAQHFFRDTFVRGRHNRAENLH